MADRVVTLSLDEITLDEAVNIRFDLDEPTILRYMETFDKLPPVEVVETDEGKYLVDGFHRTEAALRLGKKEIQAKISKGTKDDAMELASLANLKHGLPLETREMEQVIVRLDALGRKTLEITEKTGMSASSVRTILRAAQTKENIGKVYLGRKQLLEIGAAPAEMQEALARAARDQDWTPGQARDVVQRINKDPNAKVHDVLDQAVPHLKAMRERLQYVRMFDQVLDTVRHLDAAGVTPARLAASIDDAEIAERWRGQLEKTLRYIGEVEERLEKGQVMRVVK